MAHLLRYAQLPPVGNLAGKQNIKPSGGTVLLNQYSSFYSKKARWQIQQRYKQSIKKAIL